MRLLDIIHAVIRNPYCQPFELRSGEIVELEVTAPSSIYLMTTDNLARYRAGRKDYVAEASLPFASRVELVAHKAGVWYLVSERPLEGVCHLRRGLEVRTARLHLTRSKTR